MHIDQRFITSLLLPAALCLAASTAVAQTPAAEPAADSRAARDAENPLRVILEASKLKARIKPEGKAEKPEKGPQQDAPASGDRPAARVAAPAPAPRPAPVTHSAGAAAETLKSVAAAPLPDASLTMPAVAPPLPVEPPPLKQIKFVEPQLGLWAKLRARSNADVAVVFTVNTDGSVSNIFVRSNPDKVLDPIVVDAVRQWRFEPIAAPREHSVVLTVSPQG